jgi:hypothetical protein
MCYRRLVHAIYISPEHGLLQRYGMLTLGEIQDLYVQGRAGKIRGPVRKLKIGPIPLENFNYATLIYLCYYMIHSK